MRHAPGRTARSAIPIAAIAAAVTLAVVDGAPARTGQTQVPTTLQDFFMPGTQPPGQGPAIDDFLGAIDGNCVNCHADFDSQYVPAEPFRHWAGSMMAQAMRDPEFIATLTIANQDAAFSGDLCLRCHTPAGWMGGRSLPTDGSGLSEPADFEGVTCHVCHRMVNPTYVPGESPTEDVPILDDLDLQGLLPLHVGSGRYVVDPDTKIRRGPRDGVNHPQGATAIYSPWHSQSSMCGTCHDVSNPVFLRQGDGTYAPHDLDLPHPTMNDHDMFPVERTYSEWLMSTFADGGVQLGGRFGGNHATGVMESCQDCHMPDQEGPGCRNSGTVRPDAPQHALNGGNTWVLAAVRSLYPDAETGLTAEFVSDAQARVQQLLADASDMTLSQSGGTLEVRVTNYSGHKLPTGYPEGRRMWVNVQFRDGQGALLEEHGAYDGLTAELEVDDTKVYEAKLGLDATMAAVTGLPEGESFHFALNNVWLKDNRIPPIGFSNAAFEAVRAAPVDYSYDDGQHWDDTVYPIPIGAAEVEVTLNYQSTSKEYIEFLRDENVTDDTGQVAYDQWVLHGRSAPVAMDNATIGLAPFDPVDVNNDGTIDGQDLVLVILAWGGCAPWPELCLEDIDRDGSVGGNDLVAVILNWST